MAICAFTKDFSMFDVTPIENYFIEEFMLRAPGDYVKVYLYGLMLCYHPDENLTLDAFARMLGVEPCAVSDAYTYWERQGVLRRVSDNPPRYEYLNLKQTMYAQAKDNDGLYQYRDFNHELQSLFGADRLLHPNEYQKVYDWVEVFGLPQEVVLTLLECHIDWKGKKFKFQTLDKTVEKWAQLGIRTAAQAREQMAHTTREYQCAQGVLKALGMRRGPTQAEIGLAHKWMADWGFSQEAIVGACADTAKGRNPSFAYLDKILERYQRRGDVTAQAISSAAKAEDAQRQLIQQIMYQLGVRGTAPGPQWQQMYEEALACGFEHDVIERAAAVCARRGHATLDALSQLLDKWRDLGMTTGQAIDAYQHTQQQLGALAARVLDAAGLERPVSAADRALVFKWQNLALPEDLILLAAGYALGKNQPTTYMDKVLCAWRERGALTREAAQAQHAQVVQTLSAPQGAGKKGLSKEVAEQRYHQRQYAEGDLDYLLVDLDGDEAGDET